jgi:hypothetical protein
VGPGSLIQLAPRFRTLVAREVSSEDVAFIQRLIAEHPEASRRELSQELCEAWHRQQANGASRDTVCRGWAARTFRALLAVS